MYYWPTWHDDDVHETRGDTVGIYQWIDEVTLWCSLAVNVAFAQYHSNLKLNLKECYIRLTYVFIRAHSTTEFAFSKTFQMYGTFITGVKGVP